MFHDEARAIPIPRHDFSQRSCKRCRRRRGVRLCVVRGGMNFYCNHFANLALIHAVVRSCIPLRQWNVFKCVQQLYDELYIIETSHPLQARCNLKKKKTKKEMHAEKRDTSSFAAAAADSVAVAAAAAAPID